MKQSICTQGPCFIKIFIWLTLRMTTGSQQEKYMKTKIYQEDNSGLQFHLQAGACTRWVDFLPLFPTTLGLSLGLCVSSTEMSILCRPTSSRVLSLSPSLYDSYPFTDSLIFSPSVSLSPTPHFQERIFAFKIDSERVRHIIYIVAQGMEMCLDLCLYMYVKVHMYMFYIYDIYNMFVVVMCVYVCLHALYIFYIHIWVCIGFLLWLSW